MVSEKTELEVLLLQNDFSNLKLCIKSVVCAQNCDDLFVMPSVFDKNLFLNAIKTRDFDLLPDFMRGAASRAFETLLHTGDGQICDTIIDKCLLKKLVDIAKKSKIGLVKNYAEFFVAIANIKTAIRSCKTNKKIDFLNEALAECATIDVNELKMAAMKSTEAIYAYLAGTPYGDAVLLLKKSMALFEKWCDDKIMEMAKKEKSNNFTVAPILAYTLARFNEVKAVRMIFLAKRNKISNEILGERLRCMYV